MGRAKDGPYRHACHECKSRHLKCDGVQPSCATCLAAGRQCDLAGSKKFLFRHDHNPSVTTGSRRGTKKRKSQLQWNQNQDWTPVHPSLKFIDKSHDLDFLDESGTENSSSEDEEPPTILQVWPTIEIEGSKSSSRDVYSASYPITQDGQDSGTQSLTAVMPIDDLASNHTRGIQPLNDLRNSLPSDPVMSPSALAQEHSSLSQWASPHMEGLFISPSPSNSGPLWPLQNGDEVILLRHFMSDLCPWFDYCDRDRHFQNVVVPASATDQTLLDAILAVSARHLGLQGRCDRYAADRHQQKCLDTLIPELNDQETPFKELLFAATIIFRLLDEMTEDDPMIRCQGHGLSIRDLIRGREETISNSSLCAASLRIELQQEVFISFVTRKPVRMLTEYCIDDRGLGPTDDWTWAYRTTACLADCLNLCYGEKHQDHVQEHERLSNYVAAWAQNCPPTFKPIGCSRPDKDKGKILPKIWFLNDCHVAGHHYLGLCRILLLAHDPTVPSIGLDRKMRIEHTDEQIREQVRFLCGIAISNRQHVPAMFTAGAAIAMCGERFTDPMEQKVLLDILIEAEAHVAWPSLRFQHTLRDLWAL
ncbi:hypothetical protein EG329_007686 [Mollisiaceae sp. DMI_Dod_QoI]|nr:hypothetical protein EG329_007686 [Helotiales sp. DMI_Dod_QoI]